MITKVILIYTLCFLSISRTTCEVTPTSVKIEKVADPVELGEGPHWDVKSQKLYYVDLTRAKIIRFDPVTGNRTYASFDSGFVGVVIPVEGANDKLVAGIDKDVVIVTWDGEHNIDNPPIKKIASLDTNRDDTRVNDGKCDAAGRFWIGTMAIEVNQYIKPNRGSLYKIGKNGKAENIISPVSISNGLTWSLQNDIMYYIDTPTYQVWAFDYNIADGSLSKKRVIFDFKKNNIAGVPDGMTNDADGNLWVAANDGNAVIQIDPKKGKLLRKIELPVDKITSVTFGGPQLDILYVTSALYDMTAGEIQEKPDSGSLFSIKGLGVRGIPAHNFKYRP